MTEMDKTAGMDDPLTIINALSAEILELEDDQAVLPTDLTENELWADLHLSGTAIDYPAAITAAADALITRGKASLGAREMMIVGARRALEDRRRENGLLPVVLRSTRESAGHTVADIAERSGLPEDDVRALEAGKKEVDLALPVDVVVAWISAVTQDRDKAITALRRSLQVGFTGEQSLAAGASHRPANIDDYTDQVMARLVKPEEKG